MVLSLKINPSSLFLVDFQVHLVYTSELGNKLEFICKTSMKLFNSILTLRVSLTFLVIRGHGFNIYEYLGIVVQGDVTSI